jgi:hypothetical protein
MSVAWGPAPPLHACSRSPVANRATGELECGVPDLAGPALSPVRQSSRTTELQGRGGREGAGCGEASGMGWKE